MTPLFAEIFRVHVPIYFFCVKRRSRYFDEKYNFSNELYIPLLVSARDWGARLIHPFRNCRSAPDRRSFASDNDRVPVCWVQNSNTVRFQLLAGDGVNFSRVTRLWHRGYDGEGLNKLSPVGCPFTSHMRHDGRRADTHFTG